VPALRRGGAIDHPPLMQCDPVSQFVTEMAGDLALDSSSWRSVDRKSGITSSNCFISFTQKICKEWHWKRTKYWRSSRTGCRLAQPSTKEGVRWKNSLGNGKRASISPWRGPPEKDADTFHSEGQRGGNQKTTTRQDHQGCIHRQNEGSRRPQEEKKAGNQTQHYPSYIGRRRGGRGTYRGRSLRVTSEDGRRMRRRPGLQRERPAAIDEEKPERERNQQSKKDNNCTHYTFTAVRISRSSVLVTVRAAQLVACAVLPVKEKKRKEKKENNEEKERRKTTKEIKQRKRFKIFKLKYFLAIRLIQKL
jgi:hypothetical protein